MTKHKTTINRVRDRYPNIMDNFNGYDGMDDGFFDELEYDQELDVPEWEKV